MKQKIVFWKHKTTGKKGHGEPMEEELADAWVDYGNRECHDIHHQKIDVNDPIIQEDYREPLEEEKE